MKKNNFFLLLKQGLKGVLKFKIQFAVIVLLSFLATLILSLSLATSNRIENNYSKVTDKYGKFDYISSHQVGRENGDSVVNNFVPAFDFVSNQFLEVADYDENNNYKEGTSTFTEYNINLSSFGDQNDENNTYNETIFTKAFASENVIKSFQKYVESRMIDWTKFNYSSLDLTKNYNPYKLLGNFNHENLKNVSNEFYDLANTFFLNVKNELIDELNREELPQYLKGSMIEGLKNHGLNIEDSLNIEPNEDESNLSNLYLYLRSASDTLMNQMNKNIEDYFNFWVSKAFIEYSSGKETINAKEFKDFFAQNYANKTFFKVINDDADNELTENKEKWFELYSYVSGKKVGANESGFITDKGWDQRISSNNGENLKNENVLKNEEDLYTKGMKGSLIHLLAKVDKEGKLNTASALEGTYPLKKIASKESLTSALWGLGNINNLSGMTKINKNNDGMQFSYLLKQKLIAQSQGFSYDFRAEAEFTDNVTTIKYRAVVLTPEWEDKITVLKGLMPKANGEILVSPGFAQKNNLKVGSLTIIGGTSLIVSGIGTEPMSYFPSSDLTVPLPNNKTGAIIYGTPWTLSYISNESFRQFVTTNYYGIYKNVLNNDISSISKRMDNIKSMSFQSKLQIRDNYNYIKGVEGSSVKTSLKINDYKSSFLRYNWDIAPIIIKNYKLVSIIISLLIMLIAVAATLIGIKKTVRLNSSQIGILKSLGTKSSAIAISYISYSILVAFIIVPVAWFIGAFAQEGIATIFNGYLSNPSGEVIFDWVSFLSAFISFGVVTLLVSYITAYKLTNKPVLDIMLNKQKVRKSFMIDKIKNKFFMNKRFSIRFSLELASSGVRKTWLTVSTVFISGFVVSGFMAIPSVVDNVTKSYYKAINYANEFDLYDPVGNAPLSTTSLSAWDGVDNYEKYSHDANGAFGEGITNYYDSSLSSTGVKDNSALPQFLFTNGVEKGKLQNYDGVNFMSDILTNAVEEEIDPTDKSEERALISLLGSIFGNNFTTNVGKSFSIMDIQLIIENIIHSQSSEFENDGYKARKEKIAQYMALLNEAVPTIMKTIMNSDMSEGDTWKEKITNIIMSQSPAYLKAYVFKSDNRTNQFEFGYNTNNFIPGVDNLFTKYSITDSNNNSSTLTGLNKNQNAVVIENPGKVFIDDEAYSKMEQLFHGTLDPKINKIETKDGFKLYDEEQIYIPAAFNKQADKDPSISGHSINDIYSNPLRLKTSGDIDIPNAAWLYDDTDFETIWTGREQEKYKWLNPAHMQMSRFSHAKLYNYGEDNENNYSLDRSKKVKEINKEAYAFSEIYKKEDGSDDVRIRPYYSYDNLYLVLPAKYKSEIEAVGKQNGIEANSRWTGAISQDDVSEETKAGWKNLGVTDTEFVWVRPYSFLFEPTYSKSTDLLDGSELKLLTGKNRYWYQIALSNSTLSPIKKTATSYKISEVLKGSTHKVKKVNVVKESEIDSYGNSLIVTDQRLANLVYGYENAYYNPYKPIQENLNNYSSYKIKDGRSVKTYKTYTPKEMINEIGLKGKNIQAGYEPNRWYTGIYSNDVEPYYITTQISFTRIDKVGDNNIGYTDYVGSLTNDMKKVTLLSSQKALMNQIAASIVGLSVLMISVIVIVASLTVVLIGDLYVTQYKRFMVVMKSLGYSNKKIVLYTFGTLSFLSAIAYVVAQLLSLVTIWIVISIIQKQGLALPFGITWWSPFVSVILIAGAYVVSILIATRKVRTTSPSLLLTTIIE